MMYIVCEEIGVCVPIRVHENFQAVLTDQIFVLRKEMSEGSVHYIDCKLAYRLLNIGDNELKVGACWLTTSRHNYKRVEEHPF